MPLTPEKAVAQARVMLEWREKEADRLNTVHAYLRGTQRFMWLPSNPPTEVKKIAEMSRVNMLGLVIETMTQAMYVDGYRLPRQADAAPGWELWQRNRMDSRQMAVHRAASAYGAAYVSVLPGSPVPVIRGASPRDMTVVYGEDDDWPMWALERRRTEMGHMFRLFDEEAAYWVAVENGEPRFVEVREHNMGVVPVVRFLDAEDLDGDIVGQVEPLIPLQDQINFTTFNLLVAQHYGAFRQRYILGWMAETEEEKLRASAAKIWTFEEPPEEIKVGEFEQTEIKGYIESREASLKHLASISQTPAHELVGQLINLSAEALAAAEAAHRRKISERQTGFGEAWEQVFELGGMAGGFETDPEAQVVWRDTETRSVAAVVDALTKLKTMGVPVEILIERIPGWTQQDVERAKVLLQEGDALGQLARLLDEQGTQPEPEPIPA